MRNDREHTTERPLSPQTDPGSGSPGSSRRAEGASAVGADGVEGPSREQFLWQISELLSSSLDYRATIQSVAQLCTAFLAEYCIVHVEDAGEIRALGIAHRDPDREQGLREILRSMPVATTSRNPVVDVLRTGRPRLMQQIGDAELASLTGASPHGGRLRELGLTSVLIVPLRARGHTLGAISLARSGDAAPYCPADLETVEELARRAALPVDNARLYREAQREAQARERTLGVVSHDLRNALNSAILHSEMLLDLGAEDLTGAHARKQMQGLRRSLEHMHRLVQDLLDAESIESGRLSLQREPLDLPLLAGEIDEMFAPLAREKGIEWYVELPQLGERVLADHVRIVQVLSNLVTNALEFTPPGGRVAVTAVLDCDVLRICVQDSGVGIPEEDLPRIFDRHWRGGVEGRRSTGSGLGLTIVRGLVQAHGGETWVHSTLGAGSSFYVTLPIAS